MFVSDLFGQVGSLREVAETTGQGVKPKPDLIVTEPLAGQARPVDCVFALLDVLLGSPAPDLVP